MLKRPLIVLSIAAVATSVFVGWLWLTTPEHNVTKEAFREIWLGMSRVELDALLKSSPNEPVERTQRFDVELIEPAPGTVVSEMKEWSAGDAVIWVGFNSEDKVSMALFYRAEETLWDRIKRWAGWSRLN